MVIVLCSHIIPDFWLFVTMRVTAPLSVQATLTTRPFEHISQTQENTCARGPL